MDISANSLKTDAHQPCSLNNPPRGNLDSGFPMRLADFGTLSEALDYAALAKTGMNFFDARGNLDHALNYAAIRHRAIELAKRLLGLGLSRGERVGIIADMNPDFICAFFACQYAGMVAVPLPVITGLGGRHGYEEHLKTVLENADASIALGGAETLEYLSSAAEGTNVEIVMTVSALEESPASAEMLRPLGDHEISHIQFSSGSTRYPLGIEISQQAAMANARSISSDALKFTVHDRVASWLPFYHDMGLIGCMIVPITCQLTVDYLYTDSFARRPAQWLRIISDNKCTISFSPTFGYDVCARRMKGKSEENLDLSSWRVAGIGGDMIQSDVMERFAETFAPFGFKAGAFVPSYGLAEATLAFSFQPLETGVTVHVLDKKELTDNALAKPHKLNGHKPAASDTRIIASCGKPMPGYKMQIRDDDGDELPENRVGGIFISGPSLMQGYHANDTATKACMDDDGWLDTGDMGYVTDGVLYITGRRKDMMIINGRNIWPQDLEWHAEQSNSVLRSRDTAAFTIENEDGTEQPVLLAQCRSNEESFREQLKKDVRAAIFQTTGVDCQIELIPQRSLPFTTSGKLRRVEAKKLWLEGAYSADAAS